MNNNPQKELSNTYSVEELLTAVQNMQSEMLRQRAELESQRQELEELRQVTKAEVFSQKVLSNKATTRRRMIRNLVTGAAGMAALGTATVLNVPNSQAATNTFDFNGVSNGTGLNTASATTTINASGNFPIFTFNNTSTTGSGTGTTPSALPIGVYAQSSSSFAIYGYNTGSGTAPTGVIGVVGSTGVLSDPFFANSNAGVVGTSATTPGTVGLSQSGSGVEGRSLTGSGVKGITSGGVGGAFGTDAADTNSGAPIRIGLRNVLGAPTAHPHDAGEISIDKSGRFYVCQAGSPPAFPAPAFTFSNPGFPTGVVNNNGSNWRALAPMIVKNGPPPSPFTSTGLGDTDLHTQGELWVDSSTGTTYVNLQTGSTNGTMLGNAGLTNQLPVFKPVGSPLQFLVPPQRYINTLPAAGPIVGGFTGPFSTTHNWVLAGVTVGGVTIPSNASAVFGSITAFAPGAFATPYASSGAIGVYPTGFVTGAATITYNAGASLITSFFFSKIGNGGQITIDPQARATHCLVDIVGYIV